MYMIVIQALSSTVLNGSISLWKYRSGFRCLLYKRKSYIRWNFNSKVGKNCIDTFMYQYHSQNINTQPYKNPNNLSCIDLFLANSSRSFYKTEILFTGLSDFHKVILSIFKTTFTKSRAKETRKATSLKSLPLNCWVIAQVTKKFLISTSLSKILY